ncbi:TetR/AcrR family transcriptional regulator [Amycolatopsis ultiminotia]|uniref:TetR/AcrR family transcriptional regulator n=1 Tax=Amycolatopsis ultiminotia TaxID=543629 RepID=A0ABP6W639_9PSEU
MTDSAGRATARGRIDKRQAILSAAFDVFARRGYAPANVAEVAEVAGVAKPTVYNHLGDKENLFRRAMEAAADTVMERNLRDVERLRTLEGDLRAGLGDVAYRMVQTCCGEPSRALRRLVHAEVGQFPELVELVQARTAGRLAEALADRLARLSLEGRLRAADPAVAAEQFLSLLTGPAEARSRLGTRKLPAAELRAIAEAATDTFVRAYAA